MLPPASALASDAASGQPGSAVALARQRVVATADLFLRRFIDVWIALALAVWLFEAVMTPAVQFPGIVMLATGLATKLAVRRGHLMLARQLLVGLMLAYLLIIPALVNGVRTPALICMPALVLLCGWLLGRRAAALLTTLLCAAVLLYWQAEARHWLSFGAELRPPAVWMSTLVAVIAVSGFVVWFLIKNYEANFQEQAALKAQLQLALAKTRALHDAIESVPSYVYIKDSAGRYTYANPHVCTLFGRPLEQIVGATDEEFFALAVADDLRRNDRRVLELGERIESEETNFIAATGETRHYWSVKSPIRDEAGAITGLCGISTDITESKRAKEELERAHRATEAANQALAIAAKFNETILLSSPSPMAVYMANGPCVAANEAYAQLTGATRQVLLAQNFHDIPSFQASGLLDACQDALATGRPRQLEVHLKTSFGKEVFAECRILPTQLNDGPHVLLQVIDLTERKRHEEELRALAFNDALTQLPNRRLLLDRLKHALQLSKRMNSHGAVLFLDLNKFKQLNDTHGHEAGDALLVEVARRLNLITRSTDTAARLGGDEFVVLLEGLGPDATQASAHAAIVAQKLRQSLSQEYLLGEVRHHGSASTGIRLFLGDADGPEQILKDADAAMYEAKKKARAG